MLPVSRREPRRSWKTLKPLILRSNAGICPSPTSTSLHTTTGRSQHHFSIGDAARSRIPKSALAETLRGSTNGFPGKIW